MILEKIFPEPKASISSKIYHLLVMPASARALFISRVLRTENFPIKQKEDARWHPAAVGRMLFSNAPTGADNRIAPGNNTVPFPEISAPLIFVGAVTCCDASYLAAHCRISHRKRRSPPQA